MDEIPIAEARADLSEVTSQVRHLRRSLVLTRRGKPQAAIVPVEAAQAMEDLGGPDAATEIMRKARGAP